MAASEELRMKTYSFQLVYQVPVPHGVADPVDWADEYVEQLLGSGCDDASIGSGRQGVLSIDFDREAPSAGAAIRSALEDVSAALSQARLIASGPDLVGMPELAQLLGCRRQSIQELFARSVFPFPVGGSESRRYVWHLAPVLRWWVSRGRGSQEQLGSVAALLPLAEYTMMINQHLSLRDAELHRSEFDEVQELLIRLQDRNPSSSQLTAH